MAAYSGRNNLTKGSLAGNLVAFAIPFLLANLLQALYGAVDLWVVGRFGGGKIGVAAVSNGSEMMHLVMSFIMGLTTGATVLIGQFFGADEEKETTRCVRMTLLFSVLMGILSSLAMAALSPHLVRWLRTPAEAAADTQNYLWICSWGVFFIFGYNALAAIFRGFGNSTAPLVFVGIACFCNVAGDFLLVSFFGMGVAGAAYATIASQALSMIFAFFYLVRGEFGFRFGMENLRELGEMTWEYLKIGLPIAIQGVLINISFLFIVSIVNAMGHGDSATAAGYGIVNRINAFAMLPAVSFAMAMAAITAQNIGANRPARAIRTLWLAVGITMSLGVVFLLTLQIFPEETVALFIDRGGDGAADVIRNGALYARSFSWEYILVPIVFCTNGFFNGCGRTFFSMANNLAGTFFIRVPVSYWIGMTAGATLFEMGFAAPLASFTTNIVALVYLLSGRWRTPRKIR